MNSFKYINPTEIIFGQDVYPELGAYVKQYGKKVLLHYGGESARKNGTYDAITAILRQEGIDFCELGGVKPNPRLDLVQEGIRLCRIQEVDFILAAGGGSVIDSAKAIAVGACYDGDVWDFYTGKAEPEKALPVGVVLTIPAAGSESSNGSVITKEDETLKRSCCTSLMYPKFAVLNPRVCLSLPKQQFRAGTADILSHIMERYFTHTTHTDLTDRMSEAAMKTLIANARILNKQYDDMDAWAELMWTGTIAHNGLLGTGKQEDWASHGIEHELSAQYDIAHGAGLAIVFPAWMKYVYRENINRFVQFAVRVFQVDMDFSSPEAIALEGISRLEQFFEELGLDTRLSQAGITDEHFECMAARACAGKTVGSFKKLGKPDVIEIYKQAL